MSEISILLVGDADRSEFRRACEALRQCGRVVHVAEAEQGVELLATGQFSPQVIVVAQSYPSRFSAASIDRLRRLVPLARVVGLLGSWCEGEARTGRPWPGVIRTYWHQWVPQCRRELERIGRGECSAWGLPITASEEERLMSEAHTLPGQRQGLIAIHARRFDVQDWLSAACRSRGLSTVWLLPPRPAKVEGAAAAIFDGSDGGQEELDQLKRLAATLHPAPVLALMDFPRIEDQQRALAAGAAAVVSKPLHVDDLFWELDRALDGG